MFEKVKRINKIITTNKIIMSKSQRKNYQENKECNKNVNRKYKFLNKRKNKLLHNQELLNTPLSRWASLIEKHINKKEN